MGALALLAASAAAVSGATAVRMEHQQQGQGPGRTVPKKRFSQLKSLGKKKKRQASGNGRQPGIQPQAPNHHQNDVRLAQQYRQTVQAQQQNAQHVPTWDSGRFGTAGVVAPRRGHGQGHGHQQPVAAAPAQKQMQKKKKSRARQSQGRIPGFAPATRQHQQPEAWNFQYVPEQDRFRNLGGQGAQMEQQPFLGQHSPQPRPAPMQHPAAHPHAHYQHTGAYQQQLDAAGMRNRQQGHQQHLPAHKQKKSTKVASRKQRPPAHRHPVAPLPEKIETPAPRRGFCSAVTTKVYDFFAQFWWWAATPPEAGVFYTNSWNWNNRINEYWYRHHTIFLWGANLDNMTLNENYGEHSDGKDLEGGGMAGRSGPTGGVSRRNYIGIPTTMYGSNREEVLDVILNNIEATVAMVQRKIRNDGVRRVEIPQVMNTKHPHESPAQFVARCVAVEDDGDLPLLADTHRGSQAECAGLGTGLAVQQNRSFKGAHAEIQEALARGVQDIRNTLLDAVK